MTDKEALLAYRLRETEERGIAGVGPSQPAIIQSKSMKFPAKNSLTGLFLASKSPL